MNPSSDTPNRPAGEPDSDWFRRMHAVDQFDEHWQTAGGATIAEFLPAELGDERRELLVELIKVDLEYRWSRGERMHVQQVSWFDALVFCNWLSQKEGRQPCYIRTGETQKVKVYGDSEEQWDIWVCDFDVDGYRLPTEAEWEHACRALTNSVFGFSNDDSLLREYAIYHVNAKGKAWPGGGLLPNAWGLFDMHGNIWEWCWDWFGPYSDQPLTNPVGPTEGQGRLLRGGAWNDGASQPCRSANRNAIPPTNRNRDTGFRVVCGVGVAARTQ